MCDLRLILAWVGSEACCTRARSMWLAGAWSPGRFPMEASRIPVVFNLTVDFRGGQREIEAGQRGQAHRVSGTGRQVFVRLGLFGGAHGHQARREPTVASYAAQ